MPATRYLIIGNGAAGATAAETIRQHDAAGEITILTAEPYPMYSRPGLAYVLINEIPATQVFCRTMAWYEALRLNLTLGRATSIDVVKRVVWLENGRSLPYDRLLIATGARAVPPPYPGHDLQGVVYLDTYDGTNDLIARSKRAKRAVVVGGGITALELSEGLAHRGVETHYLLRRDRLWSQVFNDDESRLLEKAMRAHHVHIHPNREVAEIVGDRRGRVREVRLQDGSAFKCDLLGVAIGVKPLLDVAQNTPLQTDRAILVNEYLESSVPGVYAAGDCAQVYDRWTQRHMVDILWPSAVAEGRAAGLNMVGQRQVYVKGSPFNACLLFGLHITAMGQIGPRQDASEGVETVQHVSRGSSEVWYTQPHAYRSAWASDGDSTIRLALNGDFLVGAIVIGDQRLADPLRYLIERQVNVQPLRADLVAGGEALRQSLWRFWRQVSDGEGS